MDQNDVFHLGIKVVTKLIVIYLYLKKYSYVWITKLLHYFF